MGVGGDCLGLRPGDFSSYHAPTWREMQKKSRSDIGRLTL
jgi:hypothetical protein